MKKYDLHSHTKHSRCSINKPARVLKLAKRRGLDGIAITDHNDIKGAKEVARLNKDRDFEVIIGEEVMTDQCELLVYYLKRRIKPGKYEDVIRDVRKQGAICSIAHPFSGGGRKNINPDFFLKLPKKYLPDAIETFNARIIMEESNSSAKGLARDLGLAETGGSDGHFPAEIGAGYTAFKGSLKEAMLARRTVTGGKSRFPFFHRSLTGVVILLKKVFKSVFAR
jgi:predicted metal-dependent phosphoesterase TrpH